MLFNGIYNYLSWNTKADGITQKSNITTLEDDYIADLLFKEGDWRLKNMGMGLLSRFKGKPELNPNRDNTIFEKTGKDSDWLAWLPVCKTLGIHYRQNAAKTLKKTFGDAFGKNTSKGTHIQ